MSRTAARAGTAELLSTRGFAAEAGIAIAELERRCLAELGARGGGEAETAVFVPGRVEVLGKHTDYAGGRSLLAAADRGFVAVGARRDDGAVRVVDAASGESVTVELAAEARMADGWATYPSTVVRRVRRNFPEAETGVDIVFASNLPRAAGMSSSSAFMIATFLCLSGVNRLPETRRYRERLTNPESLAEYLACVENGSNFGDLAGDRGVGTQGGSEDHTAILCGQAGQLVQYGFAPVTFERSVPFPDGYSLIIASSGVPAEKTAGARERYNRASSAAREIVALWNRQTGRDDRHLAAAIRSAEDAQPRLREIISAASESGVKGLGLQSRLNQFAMESEAIIPSAGDALAAGDLARFGELVDESQGLAETLLGNQVEETIHLAASARTLGATAASAFGAGFGGSVWALSERDAAPQLEQQWREQYLARFPSRAESAEFFQVRPGPAAFALV